MKGEKKFKAIALLVVSTLSMGGFGGCGTTSNHSDPSKQVVSTKKEDVKKNTKKDDLVVIKYGSHCANEEDPNYINPVSGEYDMNDEARAIKLEALEVVKEELGVDLQFVQYPGDTTESLLQSVLAGDPICDIARLYQGAQGIVLGQNILQPVDAYINLLGENPPPKIYGKQYFIHVRGNNVHPLSPLMYNINYLEQVPALKVDGRTVYPTDLYEKGDWTWSTFKDYLSKINDYYANSKGPERPENRIQAYNTQYREAALLAIHSNGGSIYGENGLNTNSEETIGAVKYIQDLIQQDLLTTKLEEGTSKPVSNDHVTAFKKGETVFTNFHDWMGNGVASDLAKRGESLGFIPFPRPDYMDFDDPNYRQARTGGETFAILKGIGEDKVELAIKVYFLYEEAQDRIYLEKNGESRIDIILNMDRFHPEIGEALDTVYKESLAKTVVNEMGDMVGVIPDFYQIMGDAIYGTNGSPEFEVAMEANKGILEEIVGATEKILQSVEVKDNIKPKLTQKEAQTYAFPLGTSLEDIDFKSNIRVVDNVDGELDSKAIRIKLNDVDTDTVGLYKEGVNLSALDTSGNEGVSEFDIIIYNPSNTVAPTITIKEELPVIEVNKDVASINWANDFVQEIVDGTGLKLNKIEADLSEIDTSTPGTYTVQLSVTDYVGNIATTDIQVTVK